MICSYLYVSCKKSSLCQCVHSKGNNSEEIRNISSFNKIQIDNVFDVYWHADSNYSVKIVAGKNLITFVQTNVENGCLFISDKNKCKWLRKYEMTQIHVYSPNLSYIKINGSSNFYGQDTIFADSIKIDNWADIANIKLMVKTPLLMYSQHAGTGDTYLYGWAGVSYVWTFGTGYIHAEGLNTGYSYVTSKTTGDCSVFVTKEIGAHLFSSGNIYVYGHPYNMDVEKQGSGNLILK